MLVELDGNGVRNPSVLLIEELVTGAVGNADVMVEFIEYGGIVADIDEVDELKIGPAVVDTLAVVKVPVRKPLVLEMVVELLLTGMLVLSAGVVLSVG